MINLDKISDKFIITLIAAAAVIRDESKLRLLLKLAQRQKINHKRIYEALLQTYLFAGFPSALLSLRVFGEYFPNNKKSKSLLEKEIKRRGEVTCRKIYGNKYSKLVTNISSFSPDLADWLVTEGYGKVLSRNQLGLKDRELVNIAILTVLKFDEQLYSHINGAYRTGVKISNIEKLIESLKIFGRKGNSNFGRKVFMKFIEKKNFNFIS